MWKPKNFKPYFFQKEELNKITKRFTTIGQATRRGWQFQRSLFKLT
jgi:hypothetical protein